MKAVLGIRLFCILGYFAFGCAAFAQVPRPPYTGGLPSGGVDGQCLIRVSGAPAWGSCATGSGTVTNTGTLTANRFVLGNAGVDVVAGASLTGLVLGNGASAPSAYAGTSCTNQFPRSLDAAGAATCASVALGADVSGTLGLANGGTGVTSAVDDTVLVSNGTVWQTKALPDCDDTGGNHLNYDTTTNAFSCGTSSSGGGGSGITGATNHGIMVATGATTGTSLGVATNGQLAIGSTGVDPVLATLTGTSNQVTVTNGAGSITLSTPQDIATSSAVQFGRAGLNESAPATAGMLAQIGGANNITLQRLKRNTDTAPTGNFVDYQNAAGSALWTVDITGQLTTGAIGSSVTLPATVVKTGQANTYSTGAQDFGSATSLKLPTASGGVGTADGHLGHDSDRGVPTSYSGITASKAPLSRVLSGARPNEALSNSTATEQNYTSVFTIPAGTLLAQKCLRVDQMFKLVTPASATGMILGLKLGGTTVAKQDAATTPANSKTYYTTVSVLICGTAAPGASVAVDASFLVGQPTWGATAFSSTGPPSLATNGSLTVQPTITFSNAAGGQTLTLINTLITEYN